MPVDTTIVLNDPASFWEWIKSIKDIIGIIGGGGIVGLLFTKFLPWWRTWRNRISLEKGLSKDIYSKEIIELALRYYVPPNCQSLDPAGGEEPKRVYGVKQPLFEAVDDFLNNPTEYRYIFLLADSGMGKSAFMINYYARNIRKRGRKFEIALLPLGIPDVEEKIAKIPDPANTILLLDAFDEDTLAIVDHAERLNDLLELTRNFKKVLLTCRTQFFPKDEEIPVETGIIKVGPRSGGESGEYHFHKIYLSPFTDEQVDSYIKKRYNFWRFRRRHQAREMVQEIPNLAIRPMLLTHINELIKHEVTITGTYELYQEMVEAWLIREEGILGIKREPLRKFSEEVAVDLWCNRETRKAERISKGELIELAKTRQIPLDDWQLTGRSLLNRDAIGNYKFAHRSIMEYLVIKGFIEGNTACRNLPWSDQMQRFLWERMKDYQNKGEAIPFDLRGADLSLYQLKLRKIPEKSTLDKNAVQEMLREFDFFDKSWNKNVKGIEHVYQEVSSGKAKVVVDYATNLMWQQSGSTNRMTYPGAQEYIEKLNRDRYAGYSDWRLPTIEEGMSLMESKKKNGSLYIDPVFDKRQRWIWTADRHSASEAWIVNFDDGFCNHYLVDNDNCVRAVRSG